MSATKMYNDLLFIGTYVEYISRRTKNHQVVVMDRIGYEGLKHVYDCRYRSLPVYATASR